MLLQACTITPCTGIYIHISAIQLVIWCDVSYFPSCYQDMIMMYENLSNAFKKILERNNSILKWRIWWNPDMTDRPKTKIICFLIFPKRRRLQPCGGRLWLCRLCLAAVWVRSGAEFTAGSTVALCLKQVYLTEEEEEEEKRRDSRQRA